MDIFREWKRGKLPKEVMEWSPLGKRKRGRPKFTWAEGIRLLMVEMGILEEDWNDRAQLEEEERTLEEKYNIIFKWVQGDVEKF